MATSTTMKPLYVYNGFAPMLKTFDGQKFNFPVEKVTRVDAYTATAPDLVARNSGNGSSPNSMLESVIEPSELVRLFFDSSGEVARARGAVIVGEESPTAEAQKLAKRRGDELRREIVVGLVRQNADRRAADKPAMELTPEVVAWLLEFDIDDPVYNPKPQTAAANLEDAVTKMAAAVGALAQNQAQAPQARR